MRFAVVASFALLAPLSALAQSAATANPLTSFQADAPKSRLLQDIYKQQMSFEPNLGQFPDRRPGPSSLFVSRSGGLALELGHAQARLELADDDRKSASTQSSSGALPTARPAAITLGYVGANPSFVVSGQKLLLGTHNYIPTGDPATWHRNVPTYGAVEYRHLYPGIDLSFYGNPDRLEYDFTVAPAGDPARIRLALDGAESVSSDAAGDLLLVANGRTVKFLRPVAFQNLPGGQRRLVEASYKLSESSRNSPRVIGFTVGEYDHSQPLVIDPVVDYAFYVPATTAGYLYIGASTTDAAGNTYIGGTFPYISRQYGLAQNGFFVAKYNALGTQVFYTPLGTSAFSGSVKGIAVDSSGKVYIAGEVAGNNGGLPTVNSYQNSPGSPYANGFMAVLSADGSALTYSTYFGANASVSSIAVDSSGNASIAGIITYNTFTSLPIRPNPGAPVPTQPSLGPSAPSGFVAKFNPSLSGDPSLIYSTFLGTTGITIGSIALTVDSAGDAYVTGNSTNVTYPSTPGAYAYSGRDPLNDVFVTKVNSAGTAFLYSALLGPGAGQAIAVDSSGDAYVTGLVYEDDYPTTSGAYQTTYPSGFVTELNPQGSALVYSTFLGGPNDHLGSGTSYISPSHLALPSGCASACPVYVAGVTNGSDLPLVKQVQSYVPGSTWSGFYMEVAGNGGSLLQSSYFASGSGFDPYQQVPGIGVDSSGDIYLAGDVLPLEFPTTQPSTGPTGEGFLARVIPASGAKLAVSPSSVAFPTQIIDVSTGQQGITQPTVVLENLGDQAVTLSAIKSSSSVFSQTNNCNGTVAAGGNCTLTLSYTPSAVGAQTGTLSFTSTASENPVLQLSGTGESDRFLSAACGTATPCSSLTFPDVVVGGTAPAQIITLTNLGNTAVALSSIASSLSDYTVFTNCPQSGSGLAHGQSCELSILFHPTQTGLRSGTVTITSPGVTANTITLAVSGTGLLSPNPSSLALLAAMMNFGTATIGATGNTYTATIVNNGTAPATVFVPSAATSGDATGVSDYTISSNTCSQVLPEAACTITITFSPTAAGTRSGTLTIPTSASSTPLTSSLTGIGVAQKQTLEFEPNAITFPDQVIDASSAVVTAYVVNVGPSPVAIDRVLISGGYRLTSDACSQTTLAAVPLNEQYASCSIQVAFTPTAIGPQAGTVTVVDSEGNQMPLSLAGTAVAQNGALYISPGGLNFGSLPVASTSGVQKFTVTNIGNSPVTVSGATVTGDYSISPSPAFPWNFQAGEGCCFYLNTYFTPSKVANPDNGTITLNTSAGPLTVTVSGAGEAASKAIALSPPTSASFDFGNVEVGQTIGTSVQPSVIYVTNVGTDPVTIAGLPTISGTNASDFGYYLTSGNGTCGAQTLNPGTSCEVYVKFTPSATGTRTATLTVTDDAATGGGTQTLTLTGTGTSAEPAYTFISSTTPFAPQPVATVSGGAYLYFINNSAAPVTISSVTLSPAGSFTQPGYCVGATIAANGGKCGFVIDFAPTTTGQINGTATLTDSKGNTYVAKLYGYGTPVIDALYINPLGLDFLPQPQLSTSGVQTVEVLNASTQNAAIGQATLSNPVFQITQDYCSNTSQRANYGYPCPISIVLAPTASTALGAQHGTLTVPVTYADNTTGTYTVALNATVVAPYNSAELSPTVLTFADQPVNSTSASQTISLINRSNEVFSVGALTGTNNSATGPFDLVGGNCGGNLAVGATCSEQIVFKPTTAGSGITGSLSFPITFTNGKTQTLTATYSGNALQATNSLIVTPTTGNFGSMVAGQTGIVIPFQVTNNGNQPVSFGAASLTSTQAGTNFTRSNFDYNSCSNSSLAVGSSCTFNISFTPTTTALGSSTTPVTINGLLTIADSAATGGPHKIPLVGTALPVTQTVAVSQSTVTLGNQPVGTSGLPQTIYVTNQSASPVSGFTYTLGGTNAADFTLQTNNCSGTILSANYGGNRQTCALLVTFAPATASLGARTATVTITFTGSGSPIVVSLNGTGVPPAPAVSLFPASISYPAQYVGSRSAAQFFSLQNTGSANLIVTAVGSTSTEFSISSNTCSGSPITVTPGQSCLVGVTFAPSAAGTRTGAIQFTDNAGNAAGSVQSVALSGTGTGVPATLTSPAAGTTLGTSATFTWNAGSGVTAYQLWLGTTANTSNIYNSHGTLSQSETVTGIPASGGTIFVTLYSQINGVYKSNAYTFIASGTPAKAVLTTPAPGAKLTGSSATFSWTAGTGVTAYQLWLGSKPGINDLFNSGGTANLSVSVNNLPTNGGTIFATLFSLIDGAYQNNMYTYVASGTPALAVMTAPTPGSTLPGTSATFSWTPGTGVSNYQLWLGTAAGSDNLYNSRGTYSTSLAVTGLPANGGTIFATLFSLIDGTYQSNAYTYIASGTPAAAVLTTPTPGSTLAGSSVTFDWTAGTGVTSYQLWLGTTPGASNLYNSHGTAALSATVTGLPTNGEKIYATLYSLIDGSYQSGGYTFTAGTAHASQTVGRRPGTGR